MTKPIDSYNAGYYETIAGAVDMIMTRIDRIMERREILEQRIRDSKFDDTFKVTGSMELRTLRDRCQQLSTHGQELARNISQLLEHAKLDDATRIGLIGRYAVIQDGISEADSFWIYP